MNKATCLNCTKRHPLCHSTCEEYKKYKDKIELMKKRKAEIINSYPLKRKSIRR